MTGKRGRRSRRLDLEVEFGARVQILPPEERQGLLAWLRQQRRRPRRVFEQVTASGELRRL